MAKRRYVLWGCLGCGGFILLILIFIAAGVGWFAYTAMEAGQQFQETYVQLGENYKGLGTQFPFTPPEDGVIPESRYEAFLQVRGDIAIAASEYFKRFEEIGAKIGDQFENGGLFDKIRGLGSIKEIITTGINMIPELGNEHVQLLTQHEMSIQEYAWICEASIASLAKAQENNNAEADAIWTTYQNKLSEMQKNMNQQNWNQNNQNMNFDYNNFMNIVNGVDYKAENAALVIANKDAFLEHDHASIIDYFVIQFAEQELSHSTALTNPGN